MADPLTALIHAVQVMNFLKTMIIKTLREREESANAATVIQQCSDSPSDKDELNSSEPIEKSSLNSSQRTIDSTILDATALDKLLFSAGHNPENTVGEDFQCFEKNDEVEIPTLRNGSIQDGSENGIANRDIEGLLDRFSLRKGVRKLCRHPVFHLSRSMKKSGELGIVESGEGREAWV